MVIYVPLVCYLPYNSRLEVIMFTKFFNWLTEGERKWANYGACLISVKKPNNA